MLRIGTAVDAHGVADEDRPLMMACLKFADTGGLAGHSDADVAAHAVTDALLIASGIGELGTVFGVDQSQWAGASGEVLLREAVRLLSEDGWSIHNVSVQVIGQFPRMSPRKTEAEQVMSQIVGAPVSVAATTTDHLGFLGRKEGVAAIATALVEKP